MLVTMRQVVRDLSGQLLADVRVGHRFTLAHGLIQRVEIDAPQVSPPTA